jgi:GTP cyclohydrolase I
MNLKDIQNQSDHRKIDINKVGVKNIRYPIIVLDKKNKIQHTVATINMYVNLPHHFKGTHMSRFIEILNTYRQGISIKNLSQILIKMKEKLHSESAHIEIEFPYFIEKQAPVTRAKSLMEYTCHIWGMHNRKADLIVGVEVPLMTLCPCSKEISNYGAHNQRSLVTVKVRFRRFFWIEDLIEIIENCASSEIYPLLKRPDEKFVTEKAFDNPMFVEDVVRSIGEKLDRDLNIVWYSVESENLESIHNHSAYAFIEKDVGNIAEENQYFNRIEADNKF